MSTPLILFIKLPKTGGTSISAYLTNHFKQQDLYNSVPPHTIHKNTSVILQWGDHFIKHLSSDEDKDRLRQARRLAVVRSPYSKCLSAHNYIRNTIKTPFFIENDINTCLKQKRDFWNLHDQIHFSRTQTDLLYGERQQPKGLYGRQVDRSIDGFWLHDLTILKQENLSEEFGNFMSALGLPLTELPNLMRSQYTERYLSEESVELINNIYHDDFINFNYKKINTYYKQETALY